MARDLGAFLSEGLPFFQSFDRIIVYYDNGQKEVTNLVNAVFNSFLDADVRKVRPCDHCPFQAADMACAVELLDAKLSDDTLGRSDLEFWNLISLAANVG